MYVTKDDLLKRRRKLRDTYTYSQFHRLEEDVVEPKNVISARKYPALTIKSDVAQKLRQLEKTEVLSQPRYEAVELHKEIQRSSLRILKIRNGAPLSQVIREPGQQYDHLTPRRVNVAERNEILHPRREYNAPGLRRKSEFVLPPGMKEDTPAMKAMNQIQYLKNQIYEADRMRLNAMLDEINLRNRRRPYALSQQYEDYVKYGLEESQRLAERSGKLSSLRKKRNEKWWQDLINQIPRVSKSKTEIQYLDMLANVPFFDEFNFSRLYSQAIEKFKDPKPFRDLLLHINKEGGYLPDYKINMVFKAVDKDYGIQNEGEYILEGYDFMSSIS